MKLSHFLPQCKSYTRAGSKIKSSNKSWWFEFSLLLLFFFNTAILSCFTVWKYFNGVTEPNVFWRHVWSFRLLHRCQLLVKTKEANTKHVLTDQLCLWYVWLWPELFLWLLSYTVLNGQIRSSKSEILVLLLSFFLLSLTPNFLIKHWSCGLKCPVEGTMLLLIYLSAKNRNHLTCKTSSLGKKKY